MSMHIISWNCKNIDSASLIGITGKDLSMCAYLTRPVS